jgi:hypothetical protein
MKLYEEFILSPLLHMNFWEVVISTAMNIVHLFRIFALIQVNKMEIVVHLLGGNDAIFYIQLC